MNPISLASQFVRTEMSRSETTHTEQPAETPSLLSFLEGLSGLQRLLSPAGDQGAQTSSQSSKLDNASKSLEAQDKLGNFEIQDLMSRYNQAETLASSVAKKRDDTNNAVIGKI